MKQSITPPSFTPAMGAYSHGISINLTNAKIAFVTGQIAMDENGNVASDDIEKQTEFVFENIKKILAADNMTFMDVVKVQIFVLDMAEFPKISKIRNKYLGDSKPASTLVEVSRLVKDGCRVEIEAIAIREQGQYS